MRPSAAAAGSGAVMRAAVVGLVLAGIALAPPLAAALRPLRERVASVGAAASAGSWGDEHAFFKRDENDVGPYSWNITGTYKGSWAFAGATNGSSRFLEFVKSQGDSVLELLSTPTKISGVHYVQILPEKYCYHRKVEDSSNQPIDCVICMTTIDLTQRTSEYMLTGRTQAAGAGPRASSPDAGPHELREPRAAGVVPCQCHGNGEPTASEVRDLHKQQRVRRVEYSALRPRDGELIQQRRAGGRVEEPGVRQGNDPFKVLPARWGVPVHTSGKICVWSGLRQVMHAGKDAAAVLNAVR
nr:unnamed protein product [Digitaria exilis]